MAYPEHIEKLAKPHLTQNQLFATVCVMRDLREDAQKVDYDFVKEVYNLAFGDES
jgi:hypothetical protein